MPNEETTTKFKVDISELKKEMQEAKRSAQLAHSEFKVAASECDNWQQSSNALGAKLKALNGTLNEQKTKLALLEAEYNSLTDEQKQGSAEATRLLTSINKQKAAINSTQREISGYEDSLQQVSKAEKIASATGKDVSEVLDDIGDSAEDASDGFTVFKGAIATFAGNILTGFSNAIKSGISNIANLANETREYRNEMAKLDTAFTTNGHSAKAAETTYKELYGVLGDEGQAVEAANHLALLTNNEKELANWTNIAAGVYGTFGASLPIEGLTEAANETAKVGQVTGPLADALNWAGISEDKFNESLAKCSTEQERQKLIMDTLNDKYGEAANKFKETNADVIAANKANSDYQSTLATLGEKVEPITTKVKEGFNGILQKILELIGDVDMSAFTAKIEEGFNVLTNDVLPAIKDGFQWILDNKDTLIAGLAGIAAGFVAFKVASVINSVVTAVKAFQAANTGATVAQALLNAVMNANPIMLIATVIAAVVAAIVTFIATNDEARAKFMEIWQGIADFFTGIWQGVKDFFVSVWDGIVTFFTETIPNAFSTVINWVKENFDLLLTFLINPFAGLFQYFYENNTKFKEFVDNAVNFIKELPGKIWTWLLNTIEKVGNWIKDMASKAKEAGTNFVTNVVDFIKDLPGKIWTWLTNVVSDIAEWGSNLATKGKEAAKQLFDAIINKIKEIPDKVKQYGKDLVDGLWKGINDKVTWLKNKISDFVGNVTDWLKEFFGINSPAKTTQEMGKWLVKGLAVGITKNSKEVSEAFTKLFDDLKLQKELGVITEADYYAELKKLRDEYLEAGSSEWWSYTKEIIGYYNDATDKIVEKNRSAIDELEAERKAFAESLAEDRQMFGETQTVTRYGTEITMPVLTDWGKDIRKLENYKKSLEDVDARLKVAFGADTENYEELMQLIRDGGLDDGWTLANLLLDASDSELQEYIDGWREVKNLTDDVSYSQFDDKLADAQKTFIDELAELQQTVPEDFVNTGLSAAINFVKGFVAELPNLANDIKYALNDVVLGALGTESLQDTIAIASGLGAALTSPANTTVYGTNGGGVVNNYTQVINSPTALSRLDIYRNTNNLLNYKGGK